MTATVCNTCGGSGRWESTLEDNPTTLVPLGPCPDCGPSVAVCGNCGGAGVEYRRADDEPDHDHAWLPCSGCQHDQDPPATPAPFGVVTINHDGREWTVSYERPRNPAGPSYELTAWCVMPGQPAWLEWRHIYGMGEIIDPVSEAIGWVEHMAAEGYRPWEG